jgi:EspG family
VLRSPVRLSREAFAVTWRYADVGDLPTALYVPMPGEDVHGQARAEVRAFLELQRLAGSDRRGFTTDLEATYRLLGRAPLEYYGWMVRDDGTSFSALVVCHPQQVVLGIVDEGTVELSASTQTSGASVLVSTLPACPPARFRAASARSSELFDTGTQPGSLLHAPVERVSSEVAMLRQVFATHPTGKGQLYVAVRTPTGHRHVAPAPVNYIDPEPGRIVFYTSISSGEYITALPGTSEAIAHRLEQVRTHLTTGGQV